MYVFLFLLAMDEALFKFPLSGSPIKSFLLLKLHFRINSPQRSLCHNSDSNIPAFVIV